MKTITEFMQSICGRRIYARRGYRGMELVCEYSFPLGTETVWADIDPQVN